jgi:hypothetical protein
MRCHACVVQLLLSCLQSDPLPHAGPQGVPGSWQQAPSRFVNKRGAKRPERTLGRLAGAHINVGVSVTALFALVRSRTMWGLARDHECGGCGAKC